MKFIETSKLSREDWLRERAPYIGGSDAGAILGLNPYRSPVDVWKEKLGFAEPFAGNEATYWGAALEEAVARRYEEETGNKVAVYPYMIHDGIFSANIDRLASIGGGATADGSAIQTSRGVEIKTTGAFSWEDGVPLHYQAQVQHYMGLCPMIERFDVPVLFMPTRHFEVHPISRNDAAIRTMRERLTEWWQKHIVAGDAPEPRTEDECRALFPSHDPGEVRTASADALAAVSEIRSAGETIKALKERIERAKTIVMAEMGPAETLVDALGGKLVTWRIESSREKIDWNGIAERMAIPASIVEEFTTRTQGARVFRLK